MKLPTCSVSSIYRDKEYCPNIFVSRVTMTCTSAPRFWRRSPNWIWGDSNDTSSRNPDTVFRVVFIGDGRQCALQNLGNNYYCKRLTDEGNESCLNAGVSTIDKFARLEVHETVLSRRIYGVEYHLNDVNIHGLRPRTFYDRPIANNTNRPHKSKLNVSYSVTTERRWDSSVSWKIGVTTTISAGIPALADVSVEISNEFASPIILIVMANFYYYLQVFALRRPFLHKVLDYEDEFFCFVDELSLSHTVCETTDGSFSESLYGLRRRPVKVPVKTNIPGTESSEKAYDSALRKRQKILSVVFFGTMPCLIHLLHYLVCSVVVPYFKSKLQSIYNKEREARLQATLWGQDDARFDEAGFVIDQEQTSQAQAEPSSGQVSNLTRFKKKFASLVGVCYPWIHATNEGLLATRAILFLYTISSFCFVIVIASNS
ncbi:hypothetical protein PR202_ga24500 [Eleusine coracana subsp. coracana]|uniref:Agglutinin domain-containing protein n=1 Tax=Eleusine coracana subsp. coracana TaxID=191504 RepID=A0AAV5D7X3_ELECO|nr:hypothetical protein PR202_ga24500 [Eleusine coracana subsp. coracana]